MGKRKRIALLSALMATCFAAGAYAEDVVKQVQAYLRPDFHIVIDGNEVQLDSPTLVYNDVSYLPLKEISNHLGANVNWRNDTMSIYINTRINPLQGQNDQDLAYDEITLSNPYAYRVEYLGVQYAVLTTSNSNKGGKYYRLTDVYKMGIDTSGLKKVREKFTNWLFISEDELKKRWKTAPTTSYQADEYGFVTTEKDPEKLKSLKEYIKTWSNYTVNKVYYYSRPIIVDVVGNNEYDYLMTENGHFYQVHLVLTESTIGDGSYNVGSSSKQNIEAVKPQ